MKKLIYLLSIFYGSICTGQNRINNYEIGNYIDYNKKVINGYYDFDYEPNTVLHVNYNCNEEFTNGFYLDSLGVKVSGLLKYSQMDRTLKFKLNENDI